MIKFTVFGVGAAGNKAAITLIENNIISKEYIKILNTTSKDIPEKYKNEDIYVPISSELGGCGKEPSKGRAAMIAAINNGDIDFSELLNDDAKEVILVSSVEGGTGSGSVPVLAKYFDAMNIPVHVFALIGFQDEARGMNNTLKFFKELPSSVILHTIKNSFFLDYTKNYGKAEQAANEEFATEVEILSGSKLIPGKHNIDDTDLYKINVQPGYMTINHIPLIDIKNTDGFNSCISAAFENSCYMDNDTSAKRIAVMINASKKVQDYVDNSFEVIKRYTGVPIEVFQHIQPDEEYFDDSEEYIDVIACGMNYPEKSIREVNQKYSRIKDKLNTTRKSFDDIFNNIDIEDDDLDDFNVEIKNKVNPDKVSDLFSDLFYSLMNPSQKRSHPQKTQCDQNIQQKKQKKYNVVDVIDNY